MISETDYRMLMDICGKHGFEESAKNIDAVRIGSITPQRELANFVVQRETEINPRTKATLKLYLEKGFR